MDQVRLESEKIISIEIKDNFIRKEGPSKEYNTICFSYKECNDIKTINVEGEIMTHLINPISDQYNIYLKRNLNNFSSYEEISKIDWQDKVEKNQINNFVEEINFRLNENNDFKPFLERDKIMKSCGVTFFILLILLCFGCIATGTYVQIILTNGSDLSKIENNFKNTPSFIYFMLSGFLLAMAIYLLIVCYYSDEIKEYEKNKHFFELYHRKIEECINEWDYIYFKDKNVLVEIPMNLEYIHICLDKEKNPVIDNFDI